MDGSAPATVRASADTTDLATGRYAGSININSATAANSPANVDAVLGVLTGPILAVDGTMQVFDAILGQGNPAPGELIVRNAGAGRLEWYAEEDLPWLSLAATSGAPREITAK